ncbi:MAG TPA: exopolyphosphatase [Crocinitomicaceae bacterium]|nr:exopolyphosphatase [Crocinitomicaceae bacterium]
MKIFASIDIGSNAIRMLFEQVNETKSGPVFKKLSLVRLPVRLGEDAFVKGKISNKKAKKVLHIAHSFNHLCHVFEVEDYLATATSAMRDAKNGEEIIRQIKDETGIKVRIIPGEEEADILYESIFNTGKIENDKSYVFIDVGGGSTEINLFENGIREKWKSFNLGTVRLKEGIQDEKEWERMERWIKKNIKSEKPDFAVGTGGNINKIYKMCGLSDWETLDRVTLKEKMQFLSQFSQDELINQFDLKPDRADVIVGGGEIYYRAMKAAKLEKMIVPKVGLSDGLIRRMYFNGKF